MPAQERVRRSGVWVLAMQQPQLLQHTVETIAITVSESTGTVRIFSSGKTVMSIRSYRPHLLVKRTH